MTTIKPNNRKCTDSSGLADRALADSDSPQLRAPCVPLLPGEESLCPSDSEPAATTSASHALMQTTLARDFTETSEIKEKLGASGGSLMNSTQRRQPRQLLMIH